MEIITKFNVTFQGSKHSKSKLLIKELMKYIGKDTLELNDRR